MQEYEDEFKKRAAKERDREARAQVVKDLREFYTHIQEEEKTIKKFNPPEEKKIEKKELTIFESIKDFLWK